MSISRRQSLLLSLLLFAPTGVYGQTCQYTSKQEPLKQGQLIPMNVLLLTDPQNEQQVYLDLYWGGAVVEYYYQGTSYVYNGRLAPAGANGYLAQFSMDCCTNNYNPTQAGAYLNFPAPTTAATCGAGGTATIWSTMLDYAGNSSGLAPALGVFGGAEELASTFGGATNGYFTPYALETVAQWVPTGMGNSANGIPFYYLKLTQTVTNVSPTENNPWSFFISDYVEPIFPVNVGYPASCIDVPSACTDPSKPALGGTYTTSAMTKGFATGIGAQSSLMTSFNAKWFNTVGSNTSYHHIVFFFEGVAPGQQRTFSWYLMPGPWANALQFMQTHS
jgi:hypothetical protein